MNVSENMPLVSVVIITYNSEDFIRECLDSIYAQTYSNIELIISDDCSQDGTINICKEWLSKNKDRFVNTELIEVVENTGITKNFNRGCKIAKGEWIKPLAGDDILVSKCIELNIKYCDGHKILFSQIEKFSKNGNLGLAVSNITKKYFQSSAKFQFERLFLSNFVPAPSSFINAEYFKSMNYFDESYKMVEDYPFWLQSTYNGVKLGFFDDVTVRYRVHEKSTSTTLDVFYNVEMHKFDKIMFKNFIKYNHVKCCLKIYRFIILLIQEKTIDNGNNLEAYNKYAKLIYLNPCAYLKKLRHFIKSISNNLLSRDK